MQCLNSFNVCPFSSSLFFQCLAFSFCSSVHRLNFYFVSILPSSPSFHRSIFAGSYTFSILSKCPYFRLQTCHRSHPFIVPILSSTPYFHRLYRFIISILSSSLSCPRLYDESLKCKIWQCMMKLYCKLRAGLNPT
jgi:hypothetical protein